MERYKGRQLHRNLKGQEFCFKSRPENASNRSPGLFAPYCGVCLCCRSSNLYSNITRWNYMHVASESTQTHTICRGYARNRLQTSKHGKHVRFKAREILTSTYVPALNEKTRKRDDDLCSLQILICNISLGPVPTIIGPDGYYITDHHHLAR